MPLGEYLCRTGRDPPSQQYRAPRAGKRQPQAAAGAADSIKVQACGRHLWCDRVIVFACEYLFFQQNSIVSSFFPSNYYSTLLFIHLSISSPARDPEYPYSRDQTQLLLIRESGVTAVFHAHPPCRFRM